MLTRRSLFLSIFSLILLLTQTDARKTRFKRQFVCPPPGNACSFVTCENGGTCSDDSTIADCYRCTCQPGFTGKVCDATISVLPTGCNPGCVNGGVCNGNFCECPSGFSGQLCEMRDFCAPINPCQNGGQCTSNGASYQCDCTGTGYTGTDCTVVIPTNPCSSNPCLNGGLCSYDGQIMNCICYNGYTGAYCQIDPIPCSTAPCQNGGTCTSMGTNTYGCSCPPQFTGSQCETSIYVNHPCVTMPGSVCLNGGTCTINGASYLCNCPTGWSGTNCGIPAASPNSCNPNPCGAYGTCFEVTLPTGPTAICNCASRWTGRYCDTNMDGSCPVGYCLTGSCQMVGSTPTCTCPPLYTGARCDTLIGAVTTTIAPGVNLCSSNPCQNGATCYGNTDTYRCECVAPWTGALCEVYGSTLTTPINTVTPVVDICSSNPCYSGATCYPMGSSFTCACDPYHTGTFCETSLVVTTPSTGSLTCADRPCQNGGVCVAVGSSYSCFCGLTSIYTGKNCDSTTPMPASECPLDCTPGRCIFSGNPVKPYACLWNGIMRPVDGTTG